MSTVNFVVDQVAARTGGDPTAVRSLIGHAVKHIPEGTKVDKKTMMTALESTRKNLDSTELHGLLDRVEAEFQGLGALKQMLVFSAINAEIGSLRTELSKS